MRPTTPTVRLIASTQIRIEDMEDYLADVGGVGWLDRTSDVSDAERLVEFAGRLCYRSWEPGLNKNVTKVRTDSLKYLQNVLGSGHGSVLEHSSFTFVFHNVSRVFTHELVRHRAGVAISQESLRYVRLDDIGFRIPEVLEPHTEKIISMVETLEDFQVSMAEEFNLDDDGVPFHYKKEVTSALRRLAPLGLSTTIVWTANLRTLRHLIELRTEKGAEEEIRSVFQEVGVIMKRECPLLFDDFVLTTDSAWKPDYSKV